MSGKPPIECEEVLRHLFAYIDGELDADLEHEINGHLELCRSCFSRAEFERRLKQHLREVGQTSVPSEFEQRMRTLMDQLRTS